MSDTTTPHTDNRAVRITGGTALIGTVQVQGSKNIALHLYAAAQLADEPLTLTGAPEIVDTGVCAEILNRTGTPAKVTGDLFETAPGDIRRPVIPDTLGRRIRTTAVMAAALLTRAGEVTFPTPGGDAFCHRLIDRHLAAMEAAGADVEITPGRIRAHLSSGNRRPFSTDAATAKWGPSLGATVTGMLLAARLRGTSSILNPSVEPEVRVTAELLAAGGVGIEWEGTAALWVTGTDRVTGGTFPVPPDRLEAATLGLAGAITGGLVHLGRFPLGSFPDGLLAVFADAGIEVTSVGGGTTIRCPAGPRPVQVATGPHPGFPTDVQPQLTAFLTQASGTSRVEERIYTERGTHLGPLRAFGAVVNADGPVITVRGPSPLAATDVAGEDIRAVTALLIAALAAEGTSTIRGMYHLRRGYSSLLRKLASLGAELTISDLETP
ncbi:UDP-N-acetylglucosamine 1-carboxyvinyltransferase [Streptacidiphilus sp. P02-A3a]|uniref:UDP-N-acetylglucosamine 1-carboxyvinyltransferase n=1 Tax=Streptacidiphilus sp. P02-A3a TaxID=2704468 RepID=UPI0015F9395C|nr:UDP-N-acetylglucosamine 1-carboxyvinyltransferase [Streptacidiphilus sp. P02-A3a]QMU69153.1 UDP-N-acetylglucosamine 1-carboxyvinyltransferase [Streptacidiphilus sp. P02-A3a]